jgi:hypothetical protein
VNPRPSKQSAPIAEDCDACCVFTTTPIEDDVRANGVKLNANGAVEYLVGDLGDLPETTLDYSTFSAAGWTIVGEEAGTRFTNDRTGHGVFVSIDEVSTF